MAGCVVDDDEVGHRNGHGGRCAGLLRQLQRLGGVGACVVQAEQILEITAQIAQGGDHGAGKGAGVGSVQRGIQMAQGVVGAAQCLVRHRAGVLTDEPVVGPQAHHAAGVDLALQMQGRRVVARTAQLDRQHLVAQRQRMAVLLGFEHRAGAFQGCQRQPAVAAARFHQGQRQPAVAFVTGALLDLSLRRRPGDARVQAGLLPGLPGPPGRARRRVRISHGRASRFGPARSRRHSPPPRTVADRCPGVRGR